MTLLTLSKRQDLPGDFNPKTGRPRRGGNQGRVDWGISIVDLNTIHSRIVPKRILRKIFIF